MEENVLFNSQDVRTLDSDSIYNRIGYIQRNEFLIVGTDADNICFTEMTLPIKKGAHLSGLKFDMELIHKSIDSSNSGEVSFGEKQRIDIARFMVHDYDVLVFDETTSDLDAETEAEIYNMIFNIKEKIVITHDKSRRVLEQFDSVVEL